MPTISVVIPTFNRADVLSKSIQSVLDQSYTDYEIIVVDDGSLDSTADLVRHKFPTVKYLYQENKGPSAARNTGINVATGKYIAFLDAGDEFFTDKLREQVSIMEQNPNVVLSHTSYIRSSVERVSIRRSGLFTGNVYPIVLFRCLIATPTVMVRKDALPAPAFDERIRIAEDVVLWSYLSRHGDVLGTDKALTRVNVDGSNSAFSRADQIIGMKNIIKYSIWDGNYHAQRHKKIALYAVCRTVILYQYLRRILEKFKVG